MTQMPIGDVVGILADNLALRKSVMPISARKATAWSRGLNIPRGGERILYTGHMYQLMPAIAAMQKQMEMAPAALLAKTMWMGRIANRFINTSWFMLPSKASKREAFNRRLRNIAMLLQKASIEFGYLYEKELYAGALVFDLGGKDVFEAHAKRVYAAFKKQGVKSVITVDPHSTDMLRDVYPKIVPDYDLEVKSYLEVLAESSLPVCHRISKELVVHDSCVYARYLGMLDPPRQLLKTAGATIEEPEQAGKLTQCCGGPVEALYPEKAHKFATERLGQLQKTGCRNVVTMCPICLQNLENVVGDSGTSVRDISEYLVEAFCEG